jgi:hypothetical protein
MKDLEFAAALLHADLVEADVLLARAQLLRQPVAAARVTTWVDRWLHKHRP